MSKIKIKQKNLEVEAETYFEKEVTEVGKGAHVFVPKKFLGQNVLVVVLKKLSKFGMFGGYVKKYSKNKKVSLSEYSSMKYGGALSGMGKKFNEEKRRIEKQKK